MAKYSRTSQKTVETAMEKMKEGKLKSGKSGDTVKDPKQAIAIGLSEARAKGAKVPEKPAKATSKKAVNGSAAEPAKKVVKNSKAPEKKTARAATKKAPLSKTITKKAQAKK